MLCRISYNVLFTSSVFLTKVASVDAHRHNLREEKSFLLDDNKRLRNLICEYCQCIADPVITKNIESTCTTVICGNSVVNNLTKFLGKTNG